MKYLPLIWAALRRNPAETLLTCMASSVAFALFGLMVGLYVHTQREIELERMDRAYVVTRFPTQPYVGLPAALAEALRSIPGVTGVGTAHWLDGYHTNPNMSASVMAVDEGMPQGWPEAPLTAAQWRTLFATPNGAYVTPKAAASFGLHTGDSFAVTSTMDPQADGNPTRQFEILGLIGEIPYRPKGLLIANYRYINNSEGPALQNRLNMFYVAFADPTQAAAICRRIDTHFANSSTPTFCVPRRADAEGLANSGVHMASVTLTIAGAGLFMILFLMANVVARSVSERVPEFAVLKAIGYRRSHLMLMVVAEAVAPCVIGAVLGVLLAFAMTQFAFRFLTGQLGVILQRPEFPPSVLMLALLTALLLAAVSSLIPLRRVSRLTVIDALAGR